MKKPLLIITLILFALSTQAKVSTSKYVVTETPFLSEAAISTLNSKLNNFEKKENKKILIFVIKSFNGKNDIEYSKELWETKKLDGNTIVFIIAKNDRKTRISVGTNLETKLTNAESKFILDKIVQPNFRKKHFDKGTELAVDQIIKEIEKD